MGRLRCSQSLAFAALGLACSWFGCRVEDDAVAPNADSGAEKDSGTPGDLDTNTESDPPPDGGNDTETDADGGDSDPDAVAPVSNVAVRIHPEVATILIVSWTQDVAADAAWLKFSFENDEWYESRRNSGPAGENEDVILGVPELAEVQFKIVNELDGKTLESDSYKATTGALPAEMPRPTVISFDPSKADPSRWLLGSVEGGSSIPAYWRGLFWLFIVDRRGRVVWYFSDPESNPRIEFPRVSRDGSHIVFDKREAPAPGYTWLVRMNLDGSYCETLSISTIQLCFSETDEDTILFNTWRPNEPSSLLEWLPGGEIREIWDCRAWAESLDPNNQWEYPCFSNAVNWNEDSDTVLMSFPYINTAVEIDRKTGALVAQWGSAPGSWKFDPTTAGFEFNQYPNITMDNTLMISTHLPGHTSDSDPRIHAFVEFELDRDLKRLTKTWTYESNQDWPEYKGEVYPSANGNLLGNYGTGGVVREITRDKEIAWEIKWDADYFDDTYNNMVGHTTLIDDLYALNSGK